MTFNQLINEAADKIGLPRSQARALTTHAMELFLNIMAQNQIISIPLIGKFFCKYSPARKKRNNLTGEMITTQPKMRLRFRPYRNVRHILWERSPVREVMAIRGRSEKPAKERRNAQPV
jgi:nucleoid DNA-binding protein